LLLFQSFPRAGEEKDETIYIYLERAVSSLSLALSGSEVGKARAEIVAHP